MDPKVNKLQLLSINTLERYSWARNKDQVSPISKRHPEGHICPMKASTLVISQCTIININTSSEETK